jgi:HD-GYP domain-containing protein (c-di-GMP phosphodiesterase class II)
MNWSRKKYDYLFIGGLLHDIGKIGVPEGILNKPSRLTDEEYEKIKQHPQLGYSMLKHIPFFKESGVIDMVLYHHERYDGTGYPAGLKGETIPIAARIMAVAETFDAMTSRRSYRNFNDLKYALKELNSGKEKQPNHQTASYRTRFHYS